MREAPVGALGVTRCGKTEFRWGEKTYVMGIINLSPDSFSGDGISGAKAAFSQANRFVAEGADILDVGGQSTRPGASEVSTNEEIGRVIPVIEYLAPRISVPISIDTHNYEVARQALDAGASILNDEWGLKRESRLAGLAARREVPIILMSNQREKAGYDAVRHSDTGGYEDIMFEVISSLRESLETAVKLGVPRGNVILDPGIGFGKKWQQNLEVIRRLDELKELGRPLLVGPSRKSFIGILLDLPVNERMEGTAAAIAISVARGADIVRVHDVREMVRVARIADAIIRGVKTSV